MIPNQGFIEFGEKVLSYLEYLNYPDYVNMFKVEDVARSVHNAMFDLWLMNQSVRMTAIIIFSLTITEQVIPAIKSTKVM